MERKQFIAAAAGVAATVAAAGGVLAATPAPGLSPHPTWTRGPGRSDKNLRRVHHHLERVIDELQHDTHTYCGHRERAIDLLQQARVEIEAGLKCDESAGH